MLAGQEVEMFELVTNVINRDSALFLRQTERVFQADGPAWQNARPLYVDSLTRGTSSWPRRADRRCRRWRQVARARPGIQEPCCADIWTPERTVWIGSGQQRRANV